MRDYIKLKDLNQKVTPNILTVYMIIVSILLLSASTYAYWTQTPATRSDIVLEADSVTYLTSYLSPENEDTLLTPPVAAKGSLANNDIVIETPASVVERMFTFRLMGRSECNILITYRLYYLDAQEEYTELPSGVINAELWYKQDAQSPQEGVLLVYDALKEGYFIENFPLEQTAALTVKLSLAIVDELLDPVYKGAEFKLSLTFEAQKIQGEQQ
jgi:hypothetical protein